MYIPFTNRLEKHDSRYKRESMSFLIKRRKDAYSHPSIIITFSDSN